MLGLKGELYRRLDLSLMRRFDHLIAVSHATKDEMVGAGVRSDLISVIHNAIDTDAWSPNRVTRTLRNELNLDGAFPVIGYVGRIMPEKDLVTWLLAAAQSPRSFRRRNLSSLAKERTMAHLGELKRLAAELGIAARTHFPGYRSELVPVYAAFDIFFLALGGKGYPIAFWKLWHWASLW